MSLAGTLQTGASTITLTPWSSNVDASERLKGTFRTRWLDPSIPGEANQTHDLRVVVKSVSMTPLTAGPPARSVGDLRQLLGIR